MIRTCHKVIFGQVSVLVQDMGKKKKEKRGALAGCARICKIFGTVCLVAVILVCLPLTLPRVFGYEIYTVISGSMEPAISVGSLVYVQPGGQRVRVIRHFCRHTQIISRRIWTMLHWNCRMYRQMFFQMHRKQSIIRSVRL